MPLLIIKINLHNKNMKNISFDTELFKLLQTMDNIIKQVAEDNRKQWGTSKFKVDL